MIKQLNDRFSYVILLLITITFISAPIQAKTGSELLKLAQQRYNFQDDSYVMKLKNTVQTKEETETAQLKVYVYQGGKRQMATFTSPQRLTDKRYLVIGSNTWMYQEGLRRPIRISARQKLFGDAGIGETVGIDYYHEYQIQKLTKNNSDYILKLKAKTKDTAYQKAKVWISSQGYYKKIILKGASGTSLKEIIYQNYHQINNHEVADLVIKNLLQKKDRVTTLEYIDITKRKFPAKAFKPLMMDKFELLIK